MAKYLLTTIGNILQIDILLVPKSKALQKKKIICRLEIHSYNDFQIDNVFIYDNWQYPSNEVTNLDRTTDFYEV